MKLTVKNIIKRKFLSFNKLFSIILLIVIIVIPIFIKNPYYQDLLFMMFFYAILAEAWNFVGGLAGQISLGHTAYFGIGAYTSTLLYLNYAVSPWLGMLVGAGLALLVGIGIGVLCFRLKSHFFALASIAFAEVLRLLAVYYRGITKGSIGLLIPFNQGLKYFMFRDKIPYIYITLVLMLIVIFVCNFIKRSHTGYYLMALREDQDAAESLGVNTSRYKLYAFMISVFFVSLAGSFYSQYLLFIDPETVFNFSLSINMALFSIIGGLGTVLGPILGAFLLTPFDVLLRDWLGNEFFGLNFIIYGFILVISVMYFPSGLVPWLQKWYKKIFNIAPPINRSSEKMSKFQKLSYNNNNNDSLLFLSNFGESKIKSNETLLQVKGLTKKFGGLVAVGNVNFEIKKGEILGLIGPNGAGKTTIFNLLSGFLVPDKGSVIFNGEDITHLRLPHQFCKRSIGRTFQIVKPFQKMTVLENVMIGVFARIKEKRKAELKAINLIRFVGLSRYQDYLAGNLTIADRKKLELCRTLATDPNLLLLDEVMAGLNPKETEDIITLIKKISQQGITLLVIEHIMQAIMSLSHRILVLNYGKKIAEGTPEEVSKNKNVIEAYLGETYVTKN